MVVNFLARESIDDVNWNKQANSDANSSSNLVQFPQILLIDVVLLQLVGVVQVD